LNQQFIKPVPNIIQQGDAYYFMASVVPDETATLFKINDLDQTIEALRTYTSYRKPLAFNYLIENTYLLLTYNDTTGAVLSKIQDGFAMEWARRYDEIDNAHQKLQAFENNNRADFFVGAYNNGNVIYFNALRENGLNLTFANAEGIETGKINTGQRNLMNSFTPYVNGIAASNYEFNGQSYFISSYQPIVNDSVNLQILGGELLQDRLNIRNATSAAISLGTVDYFVNAYTTLNGRAKLSIYESSSGNQVAIKYLGGIDPLQVVKIIPTADEGIAILSKIIIAGAKERINVTKIPKTELIELL
jgi:hypothetical protein